MKLIGKAYKELPESERNEYNEQAKAALKKYKEDYPDAAKQTRKKKKKKKGDSDEDDNDEDGAKELKAAKGKARAAKDNDDEEEEAPPVATVVVNSDEASVDEEEAAERKKDMPKRPLNGYMRFANEVRSKVKEDNPDLSPKELVSWSVLNKWLYFCCVHVTYHSSQSVCIRHMRIRRAKLARSTVN